MEPNDRELIIYDEDGKETKMEILFTYENKEREANYVLFFDPAEPEQINACRYEGDELIAIEDDEEWDELEEVLETYQNDPKIHGNE